MNLLALVRSMAQALPKALLVLSMLMASQERASAIVNTCNTGTVEFTYHRAANDIVSEQALEVARPFNGQGQLEVVICTGEVRYPPIVGWPPASEGRTSRTVRKGAMDTFVRKVDTRDGKADISLAYPKDLHPFITLRVPSDVQLHSEINIGVGHIDIRGDALRGDREMNVGTGHITIFLRGDSEYSERVASVGMGSFHDRRSQGTSKHVSVSRKQRGQGNGQIVASVGVG